MKNKLQILRTTKGSMLFLDELKVLEITEEGNILYQNASDKTILDCLAKLLPTLVHDTLMVLEMQSAIEKKIINAN